MDPLELCIVGMGALFALSCFAFGWCVGHRAGEQAGAALVRDAVRNGSRLASAWDRASPADRGLWLADEQIAAAESEAQKREQNHG